MLALIFHWDWRQTVFVGRIYRFKKKINTRSRKVILSNHNHENADCSTTPTPPHQHHHTNQDHHTNYKFHHHSHIHHIAQTATPENDKKHASAVSTTTTSTTITPNNTSAQITIPKRKPPTLSPFISTDFRIKTATGKRVERVLFI